MGPAAALAASDYPPGMGEMSSYQRLEATIAADRVEIIAGRRPVFHATHAPGVDGSTDVRIRELPIIHLLVPGEDGVLDGARLLIARHLGVEPGSFDVVLDDAAHADGGGSPP